MPRRKAAAPRPSSPVLAEEEGQAQSRHTADKHRRRLNDDKSCMSRTYTPSQQSQHHTVGHGKYRGRLKESQVQSIFLTKKPGIRAIKIAGSFGVNEKTVRDIWSGRTWAKETLHLRHGDYESSGSSLQIFKPKGAILMVHLAPDHQALRPDQNHDRRNEMKFENIGQCYDELEHRSDSGFTSDRHCLSLHFCLYFCAHINNT